VGSNPTLSATNRVGFVAAVHLTWCTAPFSLNKNAKHYTHNVLNRRDAREAEGARLEIVYPANNGIVGSTPTLSAMHHVGCMACPKPDMV
jgi:hypothetical protein